MLIKVILLAAVAAELIFMSRRLWKNKKSLEGHFPLAACAAVPAVTIAIIIILWDDVASVRRLLLLYILLIIINAAAFVINEINILREIELKRLISERSRRDAELEGYKLLREKYDKTEIMRHDFKEQISALKSLIGADASEAGKYLDEMSDFAEDLNFTEYTDNQLLNILLAKKSAECRREDIRMSITSAGARLDFLSDTDTVAIFSNLINNAMESCRRSKEKNIFIDFAEQNGAITIIKAENNADEPPVTDNGALVTHKTDAALHGIGTKSMADAVDRSGGNITYGYDAERKFFKTIIVFCNGEL